MTDYYGDDHIRHITMFKTKKNFFLQQHARQQVILPSVSCYLAAAVPDQGSGWTELL